MADDHPYPLDKNCYTDLVEIGRGSFNSSIVYRAICPEIDSSSFVAIKVINGSAKSEEDLEEHRRHARSSALLNHPAILRPHCFFIVDATIWVVMPFMPAGSLQSIIASSYPDGLPEPCIAAVLKEILSVLSHIHSKFEFQGEISEGNIKGESYFYGDLKPGKVLIDSNGSVRLADSSMSTGSWMFMTGSPYWRPMEVLAHDIWSFGITALELAHGRPPLSNSQLPPSKNLTKITQSFKNMVGWCLCIDPRNRPTVEMLLTHPFIKNCGGIHVLIKNMLPEGERIDHLGRKIHYEKEVIGDQILAFWKYNEEMFMFEPIMRQIRYNDEADQSSESNRGSCESDARN